ncbi:hypothetical protein ncot_01110 [Nocardioides sp. JQ2195]|uniref:hypothetical protein n=1 Tax=Nocardioides sp. JQ2195 TaxID=2592334 RepID=UPI00143E3D89|nr:hypothetical protein [Nocardioides sp. JQ2195]QIX25340.1 hypothetical protein ncot_01110 [Nocardioides sp. JQ2195]
MRAGNRAGHRAGHLAVAVVLAATLAGCGSDDTEPAADPSPASGSSGTPAPSGSSSPSSPDSGMVEPTTNLLDWSAIGRGAAQGVVHTGADWSLTIDTNGTTATLGGTESTEIPAGQDRRIVDSFLTSTTAVVVAQDAAEQKPQQVTLVDLASGEQSRLTSPPPGPGGPWAAYDDTVAYASYRPGSDYCLATYDLASSTGEKGYCAPERHGFSNLTLSPHGLSMMAFDDKRPVSCRTLVDVDGAEVTPIEGVDECKGWEAVATADGHVWSVVRKQNQVEVGDFHASSGGTTYDLGEGATNSLTWCGDSAYFSRDADKGGKARLLRWTPDATLEIVYESPGNGEAFLGQPSCTGNVLTVSAYGEGGDEVVSATVPG